MTKTRYYVECCGRAAAVVSRMTRDGDPLVTRYADQRIDVRIGPLARTMGRCSSCGDVALLVTIKVRVRWNVAEAPKCGGACLNGKTSCDCKCNGRCHGAGECRCAA